jgi:hypothetical protein
MEVYSIKLEHFRELFQRDGFGPIIWTDCDVGGFVIIEVIDEQLIVDCIQAS